VTTLIKLIVALLAGTLLDAPAALADPYPGPGGQTPGETTFLHDMQANGIIGSDQSLLGMGYRVCGMLSSHVSPTDIVSTIYPSAGITYMQAQIVVADARTDLCSVPADWPRTS
jgi:hypothetical protein